MSEISEARKEYNYRRIIELIFLLTGKIVLSAQDVRLILGVSGSTFSVYLKKGTAPERIKSSGKLMFSITAVADWILNHETPEDFVLRMGYLETLNGTEWSPPEGAKRVCASCDKLSLTD